ncbi:hypothetical protein DCAR_0831412 [Daucus carota subsp. sativus]|uniref:Sugar phosphate transporter domain-containing protein n=1 Tax=Daucus carota subsp. sativus TaxID=79200 RepID=A0A175YLU6_DAUCS|nr:hypothetical protein DCAR_0831412 [Daucus carota subsp. sativus]
MHRCIPTRQLPILSQLCIFSDAHNPPTLSHPCSSLHRYNPLTKSLTHTLSLSASPSPRFHSLQSSPPKLLAVERRSNSVQVKAAADSITESSDDEALVSKFKDTLLIAILPLAVVHALGNLSTNMSLGKVSVSFTHTIKAMEPFFSVVLSAMFLGEVPNIWIISSLIPIVGGVGLASMTEVSFNWAGFWSAMASNLTNQSRNVLSKKLMVKKESAGLNVNQVYTWSFIAAVCYHAYQQYDHYEHDIWKAEARVH